MKRAALALLAPLAGCNWVFGLEPTHAAPDAPDAPPPGVPVHVGLIVETLDASGAPTAPIEVAFPDLVKLEAGRLDGQTPVMLTAEPDGTVSVPMDIATVPYRLIYQRAGGDLREYQGLPAEAHAVEPLLGPVMRAPPPVGSGYIINPSGYSGSHSSNRVFTIGTWTEGTKPMAPAGATLDYDLPGATSLSGPAATPGAGDRGVLIDYVIDGATNCVRATGSVDFDAGAPLPKGQVAGAWVTTQTSPNVNTPLALITTGDADPFGDATGRTAREQYGFLAANDVGMFTRAPDINRSLALKNPPMVVLRACNLPVSGAPALNEPAYLSARFGRVIHTEAAATRLLPGGAEVANGLVVLTLGTTNFNVSTNVAFPRAVMLDAADLFGASENVPVTKSATAMQLTWQRTRATDVAHFWEVALIKIAGTTLTRERVYVTSKPAVTITPSDLTSGTYVFEISAFNGRSAAVNGDFRGASGDQAMSVVYTRTFVVQ